ncbi:Uncharacterised protein [Mycobacteroides abscessus subsp. massiliense]|nr:Uncharacterised protein [Mycobacteroides abscessus subsp. massiliense]
MDTEISDLTNSARLPQPSNCSSSAASSTSIVDSGRVASEVIASSNRRSRSIMVPMLSASYTSVRNSTVPEIPAAWPDSFQHSDNENDRSMRAEWVSSGTWLSCKSPNVSPPRDSLICPGMFCHASITCTNG